jgi:hypothetical protein
LVAGAVQDASEVACAIAGAVVGDQAVDVGAPWAARNARARWVNAIAVWALLR